MHRTAFCLLVATVVSAAPARADHDSPATIAGAWQRDLPRLHVLQAAKAVRQLPASTNKAVVDRVAADAREFLSDSLAVVMVENGEVIFEGYARGASNQTPLSSYSVTKSLTALAVGEALCSGKLKSLDDKASAYAPALEGTVYGTYSLRNLLRHTSGAEDPGGNGYAGIHSYRDFNAMLRHELSLLELMKKHGRHSRYKQGGKFIYNGLDSRAPGPGRAQCNGSPVTTLVRGYRLAEGRRGISRGMVRRPRRQWRRRAFGARDRQGLRANRALCAGSRGGQSGRSLRECVPARSGWLPGLAPRIDKYSQSLLAR